MAITVKRNTGGISTEWGCISSVIQGSPDWWRSWKKWTTEIIASEVADEQMVNWRAGKKSKSNKLPAPGLEDWLCCQKPEGRSRQHFSLYKHVLQARYQSPSIQMRGWVGEREDKDWSTVAWCQFWKLTASQSGQALQNIVNIWHKTVFLCKWPLIPPRPCN